MSINDLKGLKKGTPVKLKDGDTAYFRGIEGEGRGAKAKIADSASAKKTRLIALQAVSSLA